MNKKLLGLVLLVAFSISGIAGAQSITCDQLRAAGITGPDIIILGNMFGLDCRSDDGGDDDTDIGSSDLYNFYNDMFIEGSRIKDGRYNNTTTKSLVRGFSDDHRNLTRAAQDLSDRDEIYSLYTRAGGSIGNAVSFSNYLGLYGESFDRSFKTSIGNDLVDAADLIEEFIERADDDGSVPVDGSFQLKDSSRNPDSANIEVEEDDTSDTFTIFAFDLENESSNSLELDDLEFTVTTEDTLVARVVEELYIEVAGKEFDHYLMARNGQDDEYRFAFSPEIMVGARDTVTVYVNVEFRKADGNYDSGQEIYVEIDDSGVNQGEDVRGSAESNTHTLVYGGGLVVEDFDTSIRDANYGLVNAEIEVELRAIGDDVYLDKRINNSFDLRFEDSSGDEVAGESSFIVTSTAPEYNGYYIIDEGDTEVFRLVGSFEVSNSGFVRMRNEDIQYNDRPSNRNNQSIETTRLRTDSVYVEASGGSLQPSINNFEFQDDQPYAGEELYLDIEIDNASYNTNAVLEADCDRGVVWNLKVYGDLCSDEIEMSAYSFDISSFHGPITSRFDAGGDIDVTLTLLDSNQDVIDMESISAEIQVEGGQDDEIPTLEIESIQTYGQTGNAVGVVVEWNDIPGADRYLVTTFRQDLNGKATTSNVRTTSKHATGVKYNAGESKGYCYYYGFKIETQDKYGQSIVVLDENGNKTESVSVEKCVMGTPGRTGKDPRYIKIDDGGVTTNPIKPIEIDTIYKNFSNTSSSIYDSFNGRMRSESTVTSSSKIDILRRLSEIVLKK